MNLEAVSRKFAELGARVVFTEPRHFRPNSFPILINVRKDKKGEHFVMMIDKNKKNIEGVDVSVITLDKKLVQLLMIIKEPIRNSLGHIRDFRIEKLLCGHDERHWFVANVKPEVTDIKSAFESLKPPAVKEAQKLINPKKRNRRHNPAFIRQGEWFFIPVSYDPDYNLEDIHRNEPIRRPGGSPHIVEEILRTGGEQVFVNDVYAKTGFTKDQLAEFLRKQPSDVLGNRITPEDFTSMFRGAKVLARGTIRHKDHKTINLKGWYEVHMSVEASGSANVFLD